MVHQKISILHQRSQDRRSTKVMRHIENKFQYTDVHLTILIITLNVNITLIVNSTHMKCEQHSCQKQIITLDNKNIQLYAIYKICFLNFFIFGCVGSSFPCEGFLQLRQAGTTLHRGARTSHYRGLSCCGAQAPDAQAQQLWLTGPVAPRHVGSSQTRARTHVPCIGRQILNHCATREAPQICFYDSKSQIG